MTGYTPVTDLFRHTDNPSDKDYLLSLRGGGNRGLARQLRAAEQRVFAATPDRSEACG